ncbi:MAG: hypothetical protein GFGODING_00807 [Flavobacteriales bacterium]|nr:hypothetical protein [Flavobacteriales bacterium]
MARLLPPLLFAAALACLFLGFAGLRTGEGPAGQQSGWDRLLGRVPDLSPWVIGDAGREGVIPEAGPEASPPGADESTADRARRLLREQRAVRTEDVRARTDPDKSGGGVPVDGWMVLAVVCAALGLAGAALRAAWVPVASTALGIVGASAVAIGHWRWADRLAEQGLPAWHIGAGVVEVLPSTGLWAATGSLVAAAVAGLVSLMLRERQPSSRSGTAVPAPPPRPAAQATPAARPPPAAAVASTNEPPRPGEQEPNVPADEDPHPARTTPTREVGGAPPVSAPARVPTPPSVPVPVPAHAPFPASKPAFTNDPHRMDTPHVPPATPQPQGTSAMDLLTGFARPYFALIDGGALFRKPFRILYMVLAALNLLTMLGVLAVMFKGGVSGILIGLFAIFGLWIGFQLWWDRKDRINQFVRPGSEFVALPVFAHFFQTCGEWFGTLMAIVGTGASLVMALLGRGGGHGGSPLDMFTAMAGDAPLAGLIASPLLGFLILIISRAVAEQFRALVAVANNTKAIEVNTRKG